MSDVRPLSFQSESPKPHPRKTRVLGIQPVINILTKTSETVSDEVKSEHFITQES